MRTKKYNRRGAIIVLFAFLLPILLVILGFAVDYAYMQKTRNEVRVIADLGAKAAADTLARTGGDVDAAIDAAQFIASNNVVAGKSLTLPPDQIVFGRANEQADGTYNIIDGQTPFNSVSVIADRSKGSTDGPGRMFFGQLYGRPTFDAVQQSSASFRDVEIVLVLDRSGSMKYNVDGDTEMSEKDRRRCLKPLPVSRWVALDKAMALFLRELDATQVQERVGMVTFASNATRTCSKDPVTVEEATLDAPLSQNLDSIRTEMDRLNSEVWFGGTNIRAGIAMAREHFATNGNPEVDQLIICLTDGKHNQGEGPFGEAQLAGQAGIKIHTITFGEGADEATMLEMSEETGGEHFHAPDADTLNRVFKRLAGTFAILTK